MSNNQTIDGVPRELLEYAVALIDKAGQRGNVSIELRALLDAPAVKPRPFGYWLAPKTCAGLAMFQRELIEDPVLTASVVEYFHVTPLYDALPSPPNGEPVAYRIGVNGEWFYGDKLSCIRERAEYESTFTEEDLEEAGVVHPEPLYADKSPQR